MTAVGYPPGADGGDYVVTPDGVAALDDMPRADRDAALDVLIAQEIHGERRERVPDRVADLLGRFGFGWEPLSEPGHMRALGDAAFLLDRVKERAGAVAASALRALDIPCTVLEGVSVIDTTDPVVADYLTLTSGVPGLYGDVPYAVNGDGDTYMLRQTSCFQKYSVCRERRLATGALPVALFEISDSFRREPAPTLQLSYRLRRFHLPEAHVHVADVAAAVETSLDLHERMLSVLTDLDVGMVLLVNATHDFVTVYPDYVIRLVAAAQTPALLRVGARHRRCQDGVEVDVEYKVVDSTGDCRELCTFQIDEEITRRFGVRCDDGGRPATIHTVLTGSVERYLYTVMDRIARSEAEGVPRHLPLWLAPVHARVVPAGPAAVPRALAVADEMVAAGLRVEVDDRDRGPEHANADGDACLVPALVLVGADAADGPGVRVREYRSATFRHRDLTGVIRDLRNAAAWSVPSQARRLSRTPFSSADPPRRW